MGIGTIQPIQMVEVIVDRVHVVGSDRLRIGAAGVALTLLADVGVAEQEIKPVRKRPLGADVEAVILLFDAWQERLEKIAVLRPLHQQLRDRNILLIPQRAGELAGRQVIVERIRNRYLGRSFVLINKARVNLVQVPAIAQILSAVRKRWY